ncbi:hypothetical protein GCM10025762_54010 [Haloechinothrix salitolerans]
MDADDALTSERYNYPHFDDYIAAGGELADEARFRESFRIGTHATTFPLHRLNDGERIDLAALWTSKPLVMEFGSFT